jgi:hypothetical protein
VTQAFTVLTTETTITVRSGNGSPGGLDSAVTFLPGPSYGDFGHAFTPGDFSAAQTGAAAFIDPPNGAWVSSLPADPPAQWIGTNANAGTQPANTALYAVSFNIPAAVGSAGLSLSYAADDGIGEAFDGGPNTGVYLNGTPICGNSLAYGFGPAHFANCGDVTSLLTVGQNWLYIEDYNQAGGPSPAGLLFSATITTTGSQTISFGPLSNVVYGVAPFGSAQRQVPASQ